MAAMTHVDRYLTWHSKLSKTNTLSYAGIEKFQIMKVLEERPVLVCQVKMLEDSNDQSQPVQELAQHDIQLFKDLIALNVKINRLMVRASHLWRYSNASD